MNSNRLSTGYAIKLGNITCNWVAESCVRETKAHAEKYYKAIIKDSIACIKGGIKCYLFTEEQIAELKTQMALVDTKMTFIVRETEDRYLIIPRRKRGMK